MVHLHLVNFSIKDLYSPYLLGSSSRSSEMWVKLKPDYGDMIEDIDLVVLAAYRGSGSGYTNLIFIV